MYFRQFWQDKRLEFERRPNLENLVVGAEYIHQIWTPDTFFVNEKTAYFHVATTENQFLRILHDGNILRSIRWVRSTMSPCFSLRAHARWTCPSWCCARWPRPPYLMFRCAMSTTTTLPEGINRNASLILHQDDWDYLFPLRHPDASITTEWLLWMLSSNYTQCPQYTHTHTQTPQWDISVSRLTITASCPMDLQYFPMDSQLCYIEIESCKLMLFQLNLTLLDFSWLYDEWYSLQVERRAQLRTGVWGCVAATV